MKQRFNLPVLLLALLTASCEAPLLGPDPQNTPVDNFEILWNTLDRHYALFDVKHVDWHALYAQVRPQVSRQMSDDHLWKVATGMLGRLNDPHVYITDNRRNYCSGYLQWRMMDDFSSALVRNRYLGGRHKTAGEGNMTYGWIPEDSIAYLYIATFLGENSTWSREIDRVLEELQSARALIVDIRGNPGGSSENYQYIVSSFIDRRIDYLMWKARNGPGHRDFEPPTVLSVAPRTGSPRYLRKVALLTNRFSGSSADHFNWLLKNYMPNVTQIGDTTVGDFGTIFDFQVLPNGWLFTFTARLATSMEGVALDSLGGIPPDVLVLNSRADITRGTDRVLEYAVQYLKQ